MMMCPRPRPLLLRGHPPPQPLCHAYSCQAGQGGSGHASQEGSTAGGGGGSTGGGGWGSTDGGGVGRLVVAAGGRVKGDECSHPLPPPTPHW